MHGCFWYLSNHGQDDTDKSKSKCHGNLPEPRENPHCLIFFKKYVSRPPSETRQPVFAFAVKTVTKSYFKHHEKKHKTAKSNKTTPSVSEFTTPYHSPSNSYDASRVFMGMAYASNLRSRLSAPPEGINPSES